MRQMIRRLARVGDSSQCHSLSYSHSHSHSSKSGGQSSTCGSHVREVLEGHVPVYVGEEMARFVVRTELLNRPVFLELLRRSAQEYGYEQRGVLRIPCSVTVFTNVLESLLAAAAPVDGNGIGTPYSDEDLLRSIDSN